MLRLPNREDPAVYVQRKTASDGQRPTLAALKPNSLSSLRKVSAPRPPTMNKSPKYLSFLVISVRLVRVKPRQDSQQSRQMRGRAERGMHSAQFFFPRNALLLKTLHAFEAPPRHHSFVL